MAWQSDPVLALESLGDEPVLAARPAAMCTPVLRVLIGRLLPESGGQYGSLERREFELELQECMLAACSPYVMAFTCVGGPSQVGGRSSACDLQFSECTEARVRRQGLADQGVLHLETSRGGVALPVKSQPGRVPSTCAQVLIHNLPVEFSKQGVVRKVLDCAGYGPEVLVSAEFGGELPAALAACFPSVVRGDVAVGVVRPPVGDPALQRLPRRFFDHANGATLPITVVSHVGERQRRVVTAAPSGHAGSGPAGSGPDPVAGPSRQVRRRLRGRERRAGGTGGHGVMVHAAGPDVDMSLSSDPVSPRPVSFVPAQREDAVVAPSGVRRGLSVPLHPVVDMGGRAPRDRRGLGHDSLVHVGLSAQQQALPHPPGFPLPLPALPPPHPPSSVLLPPLLSQAPLLAPPPPPLPPPPPSRLASQRPQPALPVGMEVCCLHDPLSDPLAFACIAWLQEYCQGLSIEQCRHVVSIFAAGNPAAWRANEQCSVHPPGGSFRNALRALVRLQCPSAQVDSDEEELAGPVLRCAQGGSEQVYRPPRVRARLNGARQPHWVASLPHAQGAGRW